MPGPAGPANGGARPKTQMAKPKKAKKTSISEKAFSAKTTQKGNKKGGETGESA